MLQLRHTKDGRPFITVKDCKRKTARANVTVLGNGSGKITINGKDISYFGDIQSREQASLIDPSYFFLATYRVAGSIFLRVPSIHSKNA